MMKYS